MDQLTSYRRSQVCRRQSKKKNCGDYSPGGGRTLQWFWKSSHSAVRTFRVVQILRECLWKLGVSASEQRVTFLLLQQWKTRLYSFPYVSVWKKKSVKTWITLFCLQGSDLFYPDCKKVLHIYDPFLHNQLWSSTSTQMTHFTDLNGTQRVWNIFHQNTRNFKVFLCVELITDKWSNYLGISIITQHVWIFVIDYNITSYNTIDMYLFTRIVYYLLQRMVGIFGKVTSLTLHWKRCYWIVFQYFRKR